MSRSAKSAPLVVVKLGTSVLTQGSMRLHRPIMVQLVQQCALLKARGYQVILVSSGAVACGREVLNPPSGTLQTDPDKQMLAAIGQSHLIKTWDQLFQLYDLRVAQILLTRDDFEHRSRFFKCPRYLTSAA